MNRTELEKHKRYSRPSARAVCGLGTAPTSPSRKPRTPWMKCSSPESRAGHSQPGPRIEPASQRERRLGRVADGTYGSACIAKTRSTQAPGCCAVDQVLHPVSGSCDRHEFETESAETLDEVLADAADLPDHPRRETNLAPFVSLLCEIPHSPTSRAGPWALHAIDWKFLPGATNVAQALVLPRPDSSGRRRHECLRYIFPRGSPDSELR